MQNQFKEIPASRSSIMRRKLVHGIGVNDSNYLTIRDLDGVRFRCPYYIKWTEMIRRCYSKKSLINRSTYLGCSVCDVWLLFSNFKKWMINQDWHGKHLDKDLIKVGNKVYSPEFCRFITPGLNALMTNHGAARGKYPIGVCFHEASGKYSAQINIKGSRVYLGIYSSPEEAASVYIESKVKVILQAASEQKDRLIANGLRLHAESLKSTASGLNKL